MAYKPGTKKNQIYLIDTKHKISAGRHYVSVRASINNIRWAEPALPHLLQGHLLWETPTCWQWSVTRRHEGQAGASAQSGPGHASDDVHHRDQQGPGVGPHSLVSHIVNINITHNSEGRDRNMENITGVWTLWTLSPEPAFKKLFLVLPRAPRHRDWTRINLCDWNRNLLRFIDENVYWDVTFLKRIRVDTQTLGKRGVVDSLILKVIDSPGPQSKHLSELFKPGRKLVSCAAPTRHKNTR